MNRKQRQHRRLQHYLGDKSNSINNTKKYFIQSSSSSLSSLLLLLSLGNYSLTRVNNCFFFATAMSTSWSQKPAIKWNNQIIIQSSTGCYWQQELLLQINAINVNNDIGNKQQEIIKMESPSSINYKSMIIATAKVIVKLRQIISKTIQQQQQQDDCSSRNNNNNNMNNNSIIGVPIAVAIPEGPLLPIAILAIHAMNQPNAIITTKTTTKTIDNTHFFTILIPIEPSEGKERLIHMIQDSRPCKILCVPGKDMDRLEELLSSTTTSSSNKTNLDPQLCTTPQDSLFKASDTEIINFSQLVSDAIIELQSHDKELQSYLCSDDIQNKSIDDLVVHCANMMIIFDRQEKITQIQSKNNDNNNRLSHIVYTSGTTGKPKGCMSSIQSLKHYINAKNKAHGITDSSTVMMASALSFDPCLSDILATFYEKATLSIAPRNVIIGNLSHCLLDLQVTHVLCTPTLWSMVHNTGAKPIVFKHLKVIALGGEAIPKQIIHTWARNDNSCNEDTNNNNITSSSSSIRLFATYGVTEACVYQTIGEMFASQHDGSTIQNGQNVGKPLDGLAIRIVEEMEQLKLINVNKGDDNSIQNIGEIVLYGESQIDEYTNYLNRPDLAYKFVCENILPSNNNNNNDNHIPRYHYRTGDRGYIDTLTGDLHILGRIHGEEGMVKVNGIRMELSEIETAIIDPIQTLDTTLSPVVTACLVVAKSRSTDDDTTMLLSELHAYCVLSKECLEELQLFSQQFAAAGNEKIVKNNNNDNDSKQLFSKATGILVTSGPLLTLLRARCQAQLKQDCIPSAFIIISSIPITPTGKKDRKGLPNLGNCKPLDTIHHNQNDSAENNNNASIPLNQYGTCGNIVAQNIIDCLNLQPCQVSMVTTTVNFRMLGGDSLAATRVARALYAFHHQVDNSRHLGGEYGILDGVFNAIHLIQSPTLGDYVDLLDSNGYCQPKTTFQEQNNDDTMQSSIDNNNDNNQPMNNPTMHTQLGTSQDTEQNSAKELYESLLQAITLGYYSIAIALLKSGADPTFGDHGGRLGKVSGRLNQKAIFRSSPLHLASVKGHVELTRELLSCNAKYNTPDASGLYPMQLVASGLDNGEYSQPAEDLRRLECVKLLLQAGAPITMRDVNKQTILHCAARAGHVAIIHHVMEFCKQSALDGDDSNNNDGLSSIDYVIRFFNWNDRWLRTPVHWAVINGKVAALQVLLEMGCNPSPPNPKINKRSSAAVESPIDMCNRLYGESEKGQKIRKLLLQAESREGLVAEVKSKD